MSVEDATALLWQLDAIPLNALRAYKVTILRELSNRYNLVVGSSGKNGNSLKGDYIGALANFRDHIEIERFVPPSVKIKIYQTPKDWQHLVEEVVMLEANGDLCLDKVNRPEACLGECRVIDPRNYAPFFAYRPGYVLACDMADLLSDGCLRVAYVRSK